MRNHRHCKECDIAIEETDFTCYFLKVCNKCVVEKGVEYYRNKLDKFERLKLIETRILSEDKPKGPEIMKIREGEDCIQSAGAIGAKQRPDEIGKANVKSCWSSTDPKILELKIMSASIPKTEAEHWAKREILRLRDGCKHCEE